MVSKITVVVNDYGTNLKLYITYDNREIVRVKSLWDSEDQRIIDLNNLDAFAFYRKWSELSVNHYRFLISRGLSILSKMSELDRTNVSNEDVEMTNFLILAFILRIEQNTGAEIEHFRINRFSEHGLTFDFSASYELVYDRPKGKTQSTPDFSVTEYNPLSQDTPAPPTFSIVQDDDADR